eukprot:CAMPEP_0201478704 /NCGR_PEP_ID=MMETSP0151_2-20130828/3488_1 /ASSEMBLY_ACC=CAM_ASM_000257 /TAXON_ID=200890 /ORGANISM="Paramoeba atlantica, Strain 621/1 / CCAP 1560/9" /LENGTH=226 /DNA_ID=CAMNT_0047859869 /DNA_START=54 /DNA_END=734 /DNA_ORIENTATION=-
MSQDKIVYFGLFDNGICLLSASTEGDNVSSIGQALLDKIDGFNDHRKAFSPYQGYVFLYIMADGICYLAAAHSDFPLHISFAFLERMKEEYLSTYKGSGKTKEMKPLVLKELEFFSTNPEADKLRGLKKKVSDVTDIMKENIEKVLDRGEKMEDLEDRSDILRSHAEIFHNKSKEVKCQMIRNNYRMYGIGCVIFLAIILVLIFMLWMSGVFSSSSSSSDESEKLL